MKIELMNSMSKYERMQILATAGMLSRSRENIFDLFECRETRDNQKVIENIIGMGHESIIEHDYLVFFIQDVSPIIEQIIIGQRLASFTVRSRRNVNFSDVGFYTPNFDYLENAEEVNNLYKGHMKYLFKSYSKLIEHGVDLEDARFVLPYSFNSTIVMGINARTFKNLIDYCSYGKMSALPEVKEFGQKLKEIASLQVPYLEKEINLMKEHCDDGLSWLDNLITNNDYNILDRTENGYVSKNINLDDQIIFGVLFRRYQDYQKSLNTLNKLNNSAKKEILRSLCNSNDQRELEQAVFQFLIPLSLAGLTHLTRHRMQSLLIPDFLPIYDLRKYIVPPVIQKKCLNLYNEIFAKNLEQYHKLKKLGVEDKDLVYYNLSGNMVNVSTTINGRELLHISQMRCCNKAQWEIRKIADQMVELAKKEAPIFGDYLGSTCTTSGVCHEGKESCGRVKSLGARRTNI